MIIVRRLTLMLLSLDSLILSNTLLSHSSALLFLYSLSSLIKVLSLYFKKKNLLSPKHTIS